MARASGCQDRENYDLYGTSCLAAAQLRDRLASLLGVKFQERGSGYRGGIYYRAGDLHDEHFVILSNDGRGDEDELPEPDFADKPVLLEVNATLRPDSLRELLASLPELSLLCSKVA